MLLDELIRYIGQTVTVFTTSGGATGYGFTGVLLRVNPNYITLVNKLGTTPANPVSDVMYPDKRNIRDGKCSDSSGSAVGSVCDIPIDKIAAFSHNATS